MPTPAYCTDSFLSQIHYDDPNSSSEWADILDRIDTDRDMQISMDEAVMSTVIRDLFAQIDTDGNGLLTQDEVLGFTADMILSEYVDIFRRADLNKDGSFALQETRRIAGLDEENFGEVDVDGNDRISFHEYMIWREQVDGVYLRTAFMRLGKVASN
jgi:hypothetical protein